MVKVRMIFGESLVQAFCECDEEEIRACKNDGDFREREFATQDEADAYLQGINDCFGWNECQQIVDDEEQILLFDKYK